MGTTTSTTSDLKMLLIRHIAGLLNDIEMTDSNEKDYSYKAIVEMNDRNIDLAGFLVGSLGLSETTANGDGYTTKINPVDPHEYIDKHLKQPN